MPIKIMTIMGTRPEVIKLVSFIKETEKRKIKNIIVNTEQHKDMSNTILKEFGIVPNYNLNIMTSVQTPSDVISKIIVLLDNIIKKELPDLIVVLGDTATSMAGALSAYHNKIKILHIEAGVRTYDKYNAFPEEGYRRMIDHISDYNTCQTETDNMRLKAEGIKTGVFTGNTTLDLLKNLTFTVTKKQVLITAHRREDWGRPMLSFYNTLKSLAKQNTDYTFIFVTHPNPKLQKLIYANLNNIPNIKLVKNMNYSNFIKELSTSELIMTDSGGMLQECIFLKKKIIYLRQNSEYSAFLNNECVIETGKDPKKIKNAFSLLKNKLSVYTDNNMFGDGTSGKRIVDLVIKTHETH
jgi:UDP-N-acetylglucosamine 2-epimerase (non-hydrolysing)